MIDESSHPAGITSTPEALYKMNGEKNIAFSCTAYGGPTTTITWTFSGAEYSSAKLGTWDQESTSIVRYRTFLLAELELSRTVRLFIDYKFCLHDEYCYRMLKW